MFFFAPKNALNISPGHIWYFPFTADRMLPTRKFIGSHKANSFIFYFYFFMNIYVGNLSYRVRENDLQGVMAEYGQVQSCKIIKDRETNKSKGFAFVEMDDAGAQKAIEELNGAELDGRTMVVKEARPKA